MIAGISAQTAEITIREGMEGDRKVYHMENKFYHAVFLPDQAMFPLSYYYKPGKTDVLVRKPDIEASVESGDGVQLCMPWVGDSLRRVPSKGLLREAEWETAVSSEPGKARLTATTSIEYEDPVTGVPARLDFSVTVTGRADSSRLQSDFSVFNTGANPANLMFVAHARLAPDGDYRDGDYIFTPATKCWVSDFKWPALSDGGVTPQSWTEWPVPGMDEFRTKKPEDQHGNFAYAFIPTSWVLVGNDVSGHFVLFQASPIRVGEQVMQYPYYCILMRDRSYLVEVGVSRELNAKYWEEPGAVVTLLPGTKLLYTLHMAAGRNMARADAQRIVAVKPDHIVIGSEAEDGVILRFGDNEKQ